MRGKISLLIGNKFTVTLTGKQPAGGVSGMLTVDTSNVSLLLIICTIYFIVVCWVVQDRRRTTVYSDWQDALCPPQQTVYIVSLSFSSPALHSTHCTRHPHTCSFVDLVCKQHITSISAIACTTCTPGGPFDWTELLMTYTAGRRQLRCSEYCKTAWVSGWQWV